MIHVAVAGAGAWGRNHIRVVAALRGARLDWIADPDEERLAMAEELAPGARRVTDLREALADPRLDAVIVASPTPTHVPLTRAALTAGKHVLVEKPLAPDATQAWDLVRRARRADRHLVVGHLLLHHPGLKRLKRLVEAGTFGDLHYLVSQRTNLGRIRTDEGAMLSLAPHDVSVMVHLLGTWPTSVSAHGAAYVQPRWEDVVFLTLRFPGGILGHVHLSWLDPQKVRRLSLVGSRQMAVFDDMHLEAPLRVFDRSALPPDALSARTGALGVRAGRTRVVPFADREPLKEEIAAFLRTVRTGAPSLTPGEDGARVMRVLDAAQRSLADGGREARVSVR